MKIRFAAIAVVLGLMPARPALAHHGNAQFDLHETVALKATIAEFAWGNPHSVIYFDAKNDKGQPIRWSCETVQPALLHRAGWTRESLKPGDEVTVVVHPAKNGKPVGYLIKVVLANGDELKMGDL